MTNRCMWIALVCAAGLGGAFSRAEDKPSGGPLEGAVTHGIVLAVAKEDETLATAFVVPLDGGHARQRIPYGAFRSLPVRWHIGYGHFWPIMSLPYGPGPGDRDCYAEELHRYRLANLRAGKLSDTPSTFAEHVQSLFAGGGPLRDIHVLSHHCEFPAQLHYDFLPVAEDKALLFALTDARGHLESAGGTADLAGALVVVSDEEAKTPKWSFTVHSCRNTWDAAKEIWGDDDWSRAGSIQVGFTEGFHALGQGDDYYFVTVSGKLYRAPKPDKGADRDMEAVWKDEQRPVVAFITDADAERTFLFCKPDKDGKGVYFEMGDKPDPRPYDASKVPEAKPDDPLPAVLAYAKILLADKQIKDKE